MAKQKKRRQQGLRSKDIQLLIAMGDWEKIRQAVEAEEVSYATLRSTVHEYQGLAESGSERAQEILTKLREVGVRAGARRSGPRASRIGFDEPIPRRIQVVEKKNSGHKSYMLSGISLKPYLEPEAGVKPLPEDLMVQITYRKEGRLEITW